ncbi:asparagine synthase (glutamine-hydrolyzing) [soil metagenome]
MCGIAGLWRFAGPEPGDGQRLQRMGATLSHRGPDDFGYLLANAAHDIAVTGKAVVADFLPDVLMASRRLSIIDLTPAGRQPIANEAGDMFIVFNGAIHNYVELRSELRALGHVFRSQTDTEVIVHAYEEWGVDCARRFNGMWAYAIWDRRRQQLVCSRDRFGIKPLVVACYGDAFYFASEAKAILAAGEVRAVANLSFVRQFMSSHIPATGRQTAFEGIEQLPPGHNLIVNRQGQHERRYWSYADQSAPYDFGHPEETFRDLFADAVRLRLRSEVPIALLLSGGMDSSSIAVHAQQEGGKKLEAFTATFPDFAEDERSYAELVANHSGMRLNCVEFDPSHLLDDLSSVTWHMDAPPSLGQVLARWRLLEAASSRARIVLEGQGADEMLAGYPERYCWPYIRSEIKQLSLGNMHRKLPLIYSAYLKHSQVRPSRLRGALRRRMGIVTPQPQLGRAILSRNINFASDLDETEEPLTVSCFPDHLTTMLHQDHAKRVLPHLLHFGDAISMAHSVESRLPFLDHRLVEFVFGLPFDAKFRGGESKHILRRALAEKLPPAIVNRQNKIGFGVPLKAWVDANFEQEVRPRLTSRHVRQRGIFDMKCVAQCLLDFEAGKQGAASVIFRCLALEMWFELFVDGKGFQNSRESINET